eukprot:334410-Prymnesium_polylepis.1
MALHLLHRRLSTGLVAWRTMAATRRGNLQVIGVRALFLHHRSLLSAFTTWSEGANNCAQIRLVLRHMLCRKLSVAFVAWDTFCVSAEASSVDLCRSTAYMRNRRLSVGWNSWCAMVVEGLGSSHLLRQSVLHTLYRSQATAIANWHAVVVKRRAIQKVIGYSAKGRVYRALGLWLKLANMRSAMQERLSFELSTVVNRTLVWAMARWVQRGARAAAMCGGLARLVHR